MSDEYAKQHHNSEEELDHLSAEQIEDEHLAEDLLEQLEDSDGDQTSTDGDSIDSNEGELLGDLLDEVGETDDQHETAAETIAIEPREHEINDAADEKNRSNAMPIAIIIALVAGGAYFAMQSGDSEQQAVTAQAVPEKMHAEKEAPASAAVKQIEGEATQQASKAMKAATAQSSRSIASKPVAMKPLLGDNSDAMAAKDAPTEALNSVVTVHLEIDPVTRKVISPQDGKTTFAWAVNLVSLSTHAAADRIITRLNNEGIETELVQITIGEKSFYRVRVANFTSVEEADKAHVQFKENPTYKDSWVSRYRK